LFGFELVELDFSSIRAAVEKDYGLTHKFVHPAKFVISGSCVGAGD